MHWIQEMFAQAPVRVAVIACVVTMAVQAMKRFAPALLSGYVAVAANALVSAAGVWVAAEVKALAGVGAAFWTTGTLTEFLAIVVTSAAIYGTSKDLAKQRAQLPPAAPGSQPTEGA